MSTVYESYTSGDNNALNLGNPTIAYVLGQSFTASDDYILQSVRLKVLKVGTPGNITVAIRATDGSGLPTGSNLASVTVDADTFQTSANWETFTFSTAYTVSSGTKYAIIMVLDSGNSSNYVQWRIDTISPTYSGGNCVSSNTGTEGAWGNSTSYDGMFATYGISTQITDKTYSRKLVAIGNNEVWYESATGTMSELSAANGDISTVEPLSAVEAYQKIFICNKSNKKVIDFSNTKIATNSIGSNLPNVGNTLTGGTSGATMIVDFLDASSGAANVYGLRTSIATFISGETVTGTNDDGNAVSFDLSADETSGPHWYNWIPYANDTTNYGTILSNPTLVCRYRGRVVISGDSTLPHAWQMFKVGDPFKVLYDFDNDAELSAVTYANNLVGVIGDIIVSLTAYKDDLLIFGCGNSIWGLVGDPLASGQLARITNDTGIWGANAWCIDGDSNFYFLGNDGIYKMPVGESFSTPVNISKIKLPNLIEDLDLDKSLHRVVLSYDPVKKGIIISRTLISDGTNTDYWFDLTTGGFFSESYPTSCGVFSSYYYPATDETYKKFLVGCQDGYIREFDNSTKNDTTTSSTSAIDSYFAVVQPMGEDEDSYGLLRELTCVLAGGASGGDFTDSDGVTCSLYNGNDAETVLEDIKDGATAFTSVTWSSTGKSNKSRPRMKGIYAGLKLRNNTASETWGLEKLYINVVPKGKR